MELNHPAERIKWVIKEYYEDRIARLAKAIDISPSAFNPILKGNTYPSYMIVAGIMKLHPEINPDWLIWGEEPRLRSDDPCWKIKEENTKLRNAVNGLNKIIKGY